MIKTDAYISNNIKIMAKPLNGNSRNHHIDAIRMVGVIGIIFLHFDFGSNNQNEMLSLPRLLCRWVVPFFFLASGYFFQKGYVKAGDKAYLKTLMNLFSITVIANLIYFPVMILQKWHHHENFNLISVFATGSFFHLWFLNSLLLGFLALGLLQYKKKEFLFKPIVIILLLLAILSDSYFSLLNFSISFGFWRHLVSIPLLIIGFKAAETKFIQRKLSVMAIISLLVLGLILQSLEVYFFNTYGPYPMYHPSYSFGIILLAFSIFAMALKINIAKQTIPSKYGYKYSLSIYLYHPLINLAFFFVWDKLVFLDTFPVLILKFILVVALNIFIIRLLNKKFPRIFNFMNGK